MIPKEFLDTIYHGDCKELLRKLPDESINLVVSSPPYNIGKGKEKRRELDKYLEEQEEVLKECVRVLRPTGSLFWQVGSYVENSRHIPLDIKFFPILESLGMIPRNRIIWIRPHGLHAKKRFSCRHETILWFTKSDNYKFFLDPIRVPQKYPNKKHWKGPRKGQFTSHPLGKNPGDVWAFRNVKHNHEEQTIHPCQFPEDMIERIVLATTERGDIVLDPYMGSGTTAVVARNFGRHFCGAEIEKQYIEVALRRLRGTPDEHGCFPNLKTLREYCARHGIEDTSPFRFDTQTGRKPTPRHLARIYPEHVHLERFIEQTAWEAEKAVYKRTLFDV